MPDFTSSATIHAFNWLDAALLSFCLLFIIFGFFKGITRQLLGIFAWLGAIFGAFQGVGLALPWVNQWIQHPFWSPLIATTGIFLVLLVVFLLISQWISQGVQGSILGPIDRALGAAFGLLFGGLLICLLYLGGSFVFPEDKHPDVLKTAKSTPWIQEGAHHIRQQIPKEAMTWVLSLGHTVFQTSSEEEPLPKTAEPEKPDQTVRELSMFQPKSPPDLRHQQAK